MIVNTPTTVYWLSALLGLVLWGVIWAWPEYDSVQHADFWTRQTARVAVLYWAIASALLIAVGRTSSARWFWSLGCVAYLIHVATAFTHVHHWSHSAAFAHVEEVSGFGPGIFVSYAFSLVWFGDVLTWWCWPAVYYQRNKIAQGTIYGGMAFVVFNGTVVYETGFIRWAGLGLFTLLGFLWWQQKRLATNPERRTERQ